MTKPALTEHGSLDFFSPTTRERIERIWATCWIDYPAAKQTLAHLERLIIHPKTIRPPCCLIVGDTNHGKTTIIRRFEKLRTPEDSPSDESKRMPVVYVQAPPMADVAGFYANVLRAVGAPFMPTWSRDRKQDLVLRILQSIGTKMLIVDELHNILHGKLDQRGIFLTALKTLTNDLQIPIVGVGTIEVLRVMQSDPQVGNRFESFHLPLWKPDVEFGKFLGRIGRHAGLDDIMFARNVALVKRIHAMSEGLTGEAWKVMCKALEWMDENGHKSLDAEVLSKIDWTEPKDRRRKA